MKKILSFLFLTTLFLTTIGQSIRIPGKKSNHVLLPNGWSLTPAGRSIQLGDLPLNIAVSASKTMIAITNNGQSTQTIQLIDVNKEKILDEIVIAKSWYGLKFSNHDKVLYASGGNDNRILKYEIQNNKLHLIDSILLGRQWPVKISPAGIDIDEHKQIMYVVTKENNQLYIIDLNKKEILRNL
ncbi:MAG TPA: hypothetical protein VGO09_05685, partial [Flavisolibacter sp.]|nr:hypothetical protein [Flavisolibacter sp.]